MESCAARIMSLRASLAILEFAKGHDRQLEGTCPLNVPYHGEEHLKLPTLHVIRIGNCGSLAPPSRWCCCFLNILCVGPLRGLSRVQRSGDSSTGE